MLLVIEVVQLDDMYMYVPGQDRSVLAIIGHDTPKCTWSTCYLPSYSKKITKGTGSQLAVIHQLQMGITRGSRGAYQIHQLLSLIPTLLKTTKTNLHGRQMGLTRLEFAL